MKKQTNTENRKTVQRKSFYYRVGHGATKEEEVSSPQIVDTDCFLEDYWRCYIRNLNKYKCVVLILQFLWRCLDSGCF